MREIIFPAHRLLHDYRKESHPNQAFAPLTVPSETYDTLRATLVQAELFLLRVLGFELRITIPVHFVQRYLERAFEELSKSGADYDGWDKEEQEEYGVIKGMMETRIGQSCRGKAINA